VAQRFTATPHYPDLDRALEAAESQLITRHAATRSQQTTQLQDALHLMQGLNAQQRQTLEQDMPQRLYKAGDTIFEVGDASDHLLVVMQGSAAVLVPKGDGQDTRLTSVRRGSVLGEIGFLDGAARSARVVAQEPVLAAVLTRAAFERLRATEPDIVMKLLANLTLDLAARLRHTNKLALARGQVD
jgi:sulfate permease, SulP family